MFGVILILGPKANIVLAVNTVTISGPNKGETKMVDLNLDGFGNDGENSDELYPDPLRVKLPHESRQVGTIFHISDIYETDAYGDNDDTEEKMTITLASEIDGLDVGDNKKQELRKKAKEHREEIEEINDKREEQDWDKLAVPPEDAIILRMYLRPKLTRGYGSSYSNSKLYDTLYKVDLAEAEDDGIALKNLSGDKINPFKDMEDNDAQNEALVDYLFDNLVGLRVEYEIHNSNQGTKEEYSTVRKIVRVKEGR